MSKSSKSLNKIYSHFLPGFLVFTLSFFVFPFVARAACSISETAAAYSLNGSAGDICAVSDIIKPDKEVIIDNSVTITKSGSDSSLQIVAKKLSLKNGAKIDMSAKNSAGQVTALGYTYGGNFQPPFGSTDKNNYYYYAGMPGGCHASKGGKYHYNKWWLNEVTTNPWDLGGIWSQAHEGFPYDGETPPYCVPFDVNDTPQDWINAGMGTAGGKLTENVCDEIGQCINSTGGLGGGFIKLRIFEEINLGPNAEIRTDGGRGTDGGGGGAGGSVMIRTQKLVNKGTISANGGRGGNAAELYIDKNLGRTGINWYYRWFYSGGGGGAGRIFSDIAEIHNDQGTIETNPGNAGEAWADNACPELRYWTTPFPAEGGGGIWWSGIIPYYLNISKDCNNSGFGGGSGLPPSPPTSKIGHLTVNYKLDSNFNNEIDDSDASANISPYAALTRENYLGSGQNYTEGGLANARGGQRESIFYNLPTGATDLEGSSLNNRLYLSLLNPTNENLLSDQYGLSKAKIEYFDGSGNRVGEPQTINSSNSGYNAGYPLLTLGKKADGSDSRSFGASRLDSLILPEGNNTKVKVTVLVKRLGKLRFNFREDRDTADNNEQGRWCADPSGSGCDPVPPNGGDRKVKVTINAHRSGNSSNTNNLAGKYDSGNILFPTDSDNRLTNTAASDLSTVENNGFKNLAWAGLPGSSDAYDLSFSFNTIYYSQEGNPITQPCGANIAESILTGPNACIKDSEWYNYNLAGYEVKNNTTSHCESVVYPGTDSCPGVGNKLRVLGSATANTESNISNTKLYEDANSHPSTVTDEPYTDVVVFVRKVFKRASRTVGGNIYSRTSLPSLRTVGGYTVLASGDYVNNPEHSGEPLYKIYNYILGGEASFTNAINSLTNNISRLQKNAYTLDSNQSLITGQVNLNPKPAGSIPYTYFPTDNQNNNQLPEGRVWVKNGDLELRGVTYQGKGTIIVKGNLTISNNLQPGNDSSSLGIIAQNGTVNINNAGSTPEQKVSANIVSLGTPSEIKFNYDSLNMPLKFNGIAIAKKVEIARSHFESTYGTSIISNTPPGFSFILSPVSQESSRP